VYQYDGLVTQREQIAELIEEDGDSTSRHAFKVMQAYALWFGESAEGRLLNLLGLFDHPIDKTVLRWLREQQIADLTAGMNEREFNRAVQSLIQDHHLLSQQENTPEVIDCHPLLREYFGKQLQTHGSSAWQQAHECLYHYYQTLPKQPQPDTLAEMQPLFAAVAHGCAAGLYQQAHDDVYLPRIRRGNEFFLTKKLGAFSDDLAVLAQFFSPPWSQPAASLADSDKALALNNAGFRLRALGRLREALPAIQAGLTMQIEQKDWKQTAIAANNLSELALLLGELTQAIDYGKQAVRYADDSNNEFWRMGTRTTLADALAQSGKPELALALFKEAEQLQQQRQPDYPLLYSLPSFRYCQLLLASGELDAVIQRAEQTLVWMTEQKWLLAIALDKLTLANAYSQRAVRDHKLNDQQTAADFFQQAIAGLEAAGDQAYLTPSLLDRAAFYSQSQQYDKAQQDLNRVFDIADYSGMRLYLCDYHLETARLALAQHDHASATQHHTKAEALIKATGYHRRLADCQELGRCLTKSSKT
jgi:tetratricopeptide (TPR) repeat protein